MARHFPEGYEIVRAEEVNEGERILDLGRKTELETEPKLAALNQVFKLGKLDRTTSYEEKDKLQVRECRIIYRRKSPRSVSRTGQFAAVGWPAPRFYIDPNEILRHQMSADLLAKAGTAKKASTDLEVRQASAEALKGGPQPPTLAPFASSSTW